MKKSIVLFGSVAALFLLLTACKNNASSNKSTVSSNDSLEIITEKAKKEGNVASVGMPETWANWGETWDGISKAYSINHTDTDMSSAEELAKFESEGENGTADIGDVGISFGPLAASKDLTLPYKTSYWEEIPDWAKDKEGKWMLSYTGSIAFLVDTQTTKETPTSWRELAEGKAKVSVGDVTTANQAQFAVLGASMAYGGDEGNLKPGLEYFKKIAEQGRLSNAEPEIPNLEKGEIQVAILWDFNALNYRDQIDHDRYKVIIPSDGSVMSGYSTIINKYATNPNAAKLTREYILSDEGQINLAKGYARPIRESVILPAEVKEKLLPDTQYKSVVPVKDSEKWDENAKQLPELWQSEVLTYGK